MDFTITFVKVFVIAVWLALPLLLSMMLLVMALGLLVGRIERWNQFDGVYWAFITATTVGYGDIRPLQRLSKALSIIIAFVGLIFTGITVSLAVQASTFAYKQHADVGHIQEVLMTIEVDEKPAS